MRCVKPPEQRINLHRRMARERHPLNALVVSTAAGLGVLTILGGWAWLHWQASAVHQQHQILQAQVQTRQQQLARLQAALTNDDPDPALQAEVHRLEQRWTTVQRTLALLQARQRTRTPGYSPLLRGLAQQPLHDLWLQRIRLGAPGERVDLEGLALEPAAVPRMLRTLGRQPAFGKLRFGRARIVRDAKDHAAPVTFELHGRPREEEDHAG